MENNNLSNNILETSPVELFFCNFSPTYKTTPSPSPSLISPSKKIKKISDEPLLSSNLFSSSHHLYEQLEEKDFEKIIERKVWSECFLCEEEYSKDIRMNEECLHSFCKECIEQSASTSLLCPICHSSLPSSLSSLPINYALIYWQSLSPPSPLLLQLNYENNLNNDKNNNNDNNNNNNNNLNNENIKKCGGCDEEEV